MGYKSVIYLLEDEADYNGVMFGENRYIIVNSDGFDMCGEHYSWDEAEKMRLELEERDIEEERLHQEARDLMSELDKAHPNEHREQLSLEEYRVEYKHTEEEKTLIDSLLDKFYQL